MPAPSKEVQTLRLVVDCQLEQDSEVEAKAAEAAAGNWVQEASRLLRLPFEVRIKILRYVLCFESNAHVHTRYLPHESIPHLLNLDSRRILEAPQFKHKGRQDINGILPSFTSCHIDPAVLRACRLLHRDGSHVLYHYNLVSAVQSNISGLGAKLRNYGIRVWGPLEAHQISRSLTAYTSPYTSNAASTDHLASFSPVITFRGHNAKKNSAVYIYEHRHNVHVFHALWILVKCPFARGMKFSIHVAPTNRSSKQQTTDLFIRYSLLPWMHNHIDKITATDDAKDLAAWTKSLVIHRTASKADPNVYTYNAVCGYLEQLMANAEKAIEQKAYLRAETLHELVCYEACSIVRTRTGKLVDVSTKTREGINRVCKLIAISAYRLTELRSGAIEAFKTVRSCTCRRLAEVKKKEPVTETLDPPPDVTHVEDADSSNATANAPAPPTAASGSTDQTTTSPSDQATAETAEEVTDPGVDLSSDTAEPALPSKGAEEVKATPPPAEIPCPIHHPKSKFFDWQPRTRTTRIDRPQSPHSPEALDHAILSGLLAFRLPCACPVPEWNIRLNIMLLYLFTLNNDAENASSCMRRIYITASAVYKEAKAKGKLDTEVKLAKWKDLEGLVERLKTKCDEERLGIAKYRKGKGRDWRTRLEYMRVVEDCESVVRRVWGERLMPKKGYQGLIWTFRWA
jgi:hypothetical protein